MHILCRIGLSSLVYSGDAQLQIGPLLQCLAEVDELRARLAPHMQNRDHFSTLQHRREYFCFQLHSSFVISMLARPAFRASSSRGDQPQHDMLIQRGKAALATATRAFLDLHLMDVYPRRSWSMIHQGLSSALLLGILGETKERPEILELQLRVIDVLSNTEEAEVSGTDVPTAWLSGSHVRALRALRNSVQSQQGSPAGTATPTNFTAATAPGSSAIPGAVKDEPNVVPLSTQWVMSNGAIADTDYDPLAMVGYDGQAVDLNMALQSHTGLSPMGYFDALYWVSCDAYYCWRLTDR